MRDAGRNKERWEKAPYAYPRSEYWAAQSRDGGRRESGLVLPTAERLFWHGLVSNLNPAKHWLHAGNYIEPEEGIRNRAYSHARGSDLPQKSRSRRLERGCLGRTSARYSSTRPNICESHSETPEP